MTRLPAWRWNASINDSSYVELRSVDDSQLTPAQSEMEWIWASDVKADSEVEGFAKLCQRDESLIFVTPPPGIEYNGGNFGEDQIISDKEKLFLSAGDLRVDLDFPLVRH